MSEIFDFVKEGAVNLYQFRICSSRGILLHALSIYFKPFPLIGPCKCRLKSEDPTKEQVCSNSRPDPHNSWKRARKNGSALIRPRCTIRTSNFTYVTRLDAPFVRACIQSCYKFKTFLSCTEVGI